MSEMHDAVKMLLERMKDCPEEFVRDPRNHINEYRPATKWERALGIVYEVATQCEKDALDIRQQEAKRTVYMGSALQVIVSDEEPEEKMTMTTANRYSVFGQPQITPQGSTTNANIITELEARQKAVEAQIKQNLLNTGLYK